MIFKTILVHLDDSQRSVQRLGVATRFAVDFRSELVGMYVMPTQELSPSLTALLPAEVVERRLYETGEAQHQAETLFRQAASAAGLTAIEWRAPAGSPIDPAFGTHARCADLTVMTQCDPASAEALFIAELAETVVLSAGWPTLIVPYVGARATLGQNVPVAWNGGRAASRAIADAMPTLTRARQVTVMSIHAGTGEHAADAPLEVAACRVSGLAWDRRPDPSSGHRGHQHWRLAPLAGRRFGHRSDRHGSLCTYPTSRPRSAWSNPHHAPIDDRACADVPLRRRAHSPTAVHCA